MLGVRVRVRVRVRYCVNQGRYTTLLAATKCLPNKFLLLIFSFPRLYAAGLVISQSKVKRARGLLC